MGEPRGEEFYFYVDAKEPLIEAAISVVEFLSDTELINYKIFVRGVEIKYHKLKVKECGICEIDDGPVQIYGAYSNEHPIINIAYFSNPPNDIAEKMRNKNLRLFAEKWKEDKTFLAAKCRSSTLNDLDLTSWTTIQVKFWLFWAMHQLDLSLDIDRWNMDGTQLKSLTRRKFIENEPTKLNERFYYLMRLLQEDNKISVPGTSYELRHRVDVGDWAKDDYGRVHGDRKRVPVEDLSTFLLDLLNDKKYSNMIQWVNTEDQICEIKERDEVAELWGAVAGIPNMTTSRFETEMLVFNRSKSGIIRKIPHQPRYQFLIDYKELCGMSAENMKIAVTGVRSDSKKEHQPSSSQPKSK